MSSLRIIFKDLAKGKKDAVKCTQLIVEMVTNEPKKHG